MLVLVVTATVVALDTSGAADAVDEPEAVGVGVTIDAADAVVVSLGGGAADTVGAGISAGPAGAGATPPAL